MANRPIQRRHHQPAFVLPTMRRIVVEDAPGVVILRVVDQHTGQELSRMEFTPDGAEEMARYFWSAAGCAAGALLDGRERRKAPNV
ncbi:MAG TPA: hypothetical protein VL356_05375 [Acidocella sp.]|jgi:hypothetical protein|nr:hypothetical protein [Acidocella sp.]